MSKETGRVCFVSVDAEHDVGTGGQKKFRGIGEMDALLAVFATRRISATLFVTGEVLKNYTVQVQAWSRENEIASHSYSHTYFSELSDAEKHSDVEKFVALYTDTFGSTPKGFRAPSHVIDETTVKILGRYGFSYDSSVVPHYPPLKKYRGYRGKAPHSPYEVHGLLELPVTGQLLGIPLAGAWIRKLPFLLYALLFEVHKPQFITLSMHSWDALDERFTPKLVKILEILKKKGYVFKSGEQIASELGSGTVGRAA